MSDPRVTGAVALRPGRRAARACCTRASSALRIRTRASLGRRVAAYRPSVVVLTPDDVRDLGTLRLPDPGRDGARARHRPLRRRPRRRRRRARRAAEADEALRLVAVDYEELPAVLDVLEAAAPGAPLVHERDRGLRRATRPTSACARSRGRTSATASGSAHGDVEAGCRSAPTSSSRRPTGRAGAQHAADGAARLRSPAGRRRAARGLDRDADAVQRARGSRPHLRARPDAGPGRLPADGRLVRRRRRSSGSKAIVAALARKAGRPVKARARPRARSGRR